MSKHFFFTFTPLQTASHILKQLPDQELLAEYKKTEEQFYLGELYTRYTHMVYGVCVKYLEDNELAKDAVMNIYTELIAKVLKHDIDNFTGWLYMLSKNHCLMQLRKQKQAIKVEFNINLMQNTEFEHLDAVLEKEKDFKLLEKCMEQLNLEQHKVITMFYLQQKCYNDIADITGIEWNKVRSLIQNGRRNLKNCMQQNG